MNNSFLFLIPLTPSSHLTKNRRALRILCLNNLLNQTYDNWKAILIGQRDETIPNSDHFIVLDIVGQKEEKLQNTTKFITENKLIFDYMIRLDDDDLFNPKLLKKLSGIYFDICIDKFHTFWDASTGKIAQQVPLWFANTCIHNTKHALTVFGKFPRDTQVFTKQYPYLIENGHGDFHKYYDQNSIIIVADRYDPVYVRTLNPDSHSSNYNGNFANYMNLFGFWKYKKLRSYDFIREFDLPEKSTENRHTQNILFWIKSTYAMIKGWLLFRKHVISKNEHRAN